MHADFHGVALSRDAATEVVGNKNLENATKSTNQKSTKHEREGRAQTSPGNSLGAHVLQLCVIFSCCMGRQTALSSAFIFFHRHTGKIIDQASPLL